MSEKHDFRLAWLALSLLLLFAAGDRVYAATAGKITGVVTDAVSGEALPGVNVVMVGTVRGTTTDPEGRYLILAVEPGVYSLTASMIGYGGETVRDLKVVVGYTTTIDFALREATLEMAEVVVVAERALVEPDKTTSKYVVTVADIESVPMVRSSSELVALQPGMALDGSNRIRGSQGGGYSGVGAGGVGYYIDGIEVAQGAFADVNVSAVQEVSVLTGGMNAEFGNARAGVVTLVTREGGEKVHGKGEYRLTPSGKRHWGENLYDSPSHKDKIKWDDLDWVNETDPVTGELAHQRTDYTGHTGHYVEGSLSGPLAGNSSFFVSSRYSQGVSRQPAAEPTSPFNTRSLATLTLRPSGNLKLKVGGLYERHKNYYVPNSGWGGVVKGMGASGRNIFLPEDWAAAGRQEFTDDMLYATMTHSLGTKTYYEVKAYTVASRQEPIDVPDVTEPYRTDASGWFYLPRKIHAYRDYYDRRTGIKFDFTSQVARAHLFQAGAEVSRHNYYDTQVRFGPTPKQRWFYVAGKDYEMGEGVRPWRASLYAQDKLEYHGLIVNAGVRWDYLNFARKAHQAPGMALFPMFDTFTRRKWELKYLDDSTPTMTSLSPRVGISHPISDRLSGHYFIGRFYNFPPFHELYGVTYASEKPDVDLNDNGKIDPAEKWNAMITQSGRESAEGMQPEAATSIEMGVDWNFYQDYVTSVTTHYRFDEGLYHTGGTWLYDPFLGATHYVSAARNATAAKARGLELALRKNFSQHFSFRVAYDMTWVSSTGRYAGYGDRESWRIYPDSSYVASGRYWVNWKVESDGSETPIPLTPDEIRDLGAKANAIKAGWVASAGETIATGYYTEPVRINEAGIWLTTSGYGDKQEPARHDRRSQLSVQFFYASPLDYGPRAGGIYPFGGLRVSSVYRMVDGLPFLYTPPTGSDEWKVESPIMRTDLHAEKEFSAIGGVRPTLFVEVTNLFSEKSSTTRYSDYSFVQYGLKEPAPDDENYLDYGDTKDYNRYRYDPRLIQLGLTLRF